MALNHGFEYREQISVRSGGLSVLDYLSRRYRHSSEEVWKDRIENGEIFLDGREARSEAVPTPGQWLVWRRPPWIEADVPLTYGVLYEDEDLLAVDKPGGLPTLPGGGFLESTLLALVRKSRPEAAPIHRLGRGTSGIVLFACSARARSVLCEEFRRREAAKTYRALANGVPPGDAFAVEARIGPVPHPRIGMVYAACATGKPALSRVVVLERRVDRSLLEVSIETGRPHQIRIHLAFAGYPLVGDPLYVAGGMPMETGTGLPGDCGYFLHAERLCIRHPVTGSPLEIRSRPPPELRLQAEMQP